MAQPTIKVAKSGALWKITLHQKDKEPQTLGFKQSKPDAVHAAKHFAEIHGAKLVGCGCKHDPKKNVVSPHLVKKVMAMYPSAKDEHILRGTDALDQLRDDLDKASREQERLHQAAARTWRPGDGPHPSSTRRKRIWNEWHGSYQAIVYSEPDGHYGWEVKDRGGQVIASSGETHTETVAGAKARAWHAISEQMMNETK